MKNMLHPGQQPFFCIPFREIACRVQFQAVIFVSVLAAFLSRIDHMQRPLQVRVRGQAKRRAGKHSA